MVRFSCFNAHIHNHKTKKTGQPTIVTMQKMLQDCSQIEVPKDSRTPESAQVDMQINSTAQNSTTSPSVESGSKSEEMKIKFSVESDVKVHRVGNLKKSQSLGSALYQHSKVSGDNDMEDETEQGYSCDGSYHNNTLAMPVSDRFRKNPSTESLLLTSDPLNNGSIFSLGEQVHPEKDTAENSDTVLSGEYAVDYGNNRVTSPLHAIVKSSSLPNIVASVPPPEVVSSFNYIAPRSRSSEDLHVLEIRRRDSLAIKVEAQVIQDQAKDSVWRTERSNVENPVDDGYESCNYASSAKDWVMPAVDDEVNPVQILKGESSAPQWEELPCKDFKIKRIEDWVTELQYCDPVEEESIELDSSDDHVKKELNVPNGLNTAKVDEKLTPGMEAAKRYISSLSAATTTAQLANHGLVVIPFLSAFVSLRVLNLSGNAIVRITAGALPRGLHMLNLSKNFISTIEGLRELTRLRVLDLSYNRIFRIGHGLASCSSLKELYLAGNKISEVEGLHRLLKLTVLDLRFNKISTAKCLGQLAANYNSLQAISLEGNPAQKNVGDEQLKKSLQSLLPHLAYYNRQPMKVSTLKEAPERSVRLGVSAHQFDRGLAKGSRKGSQGSHKPSSSMHGRKSQAMLSPKPSRARLGHGHGHGRLPPNPTGTKVSIQRHHHLDLGNKLMSYRSEASMRRSRSEGTLGAL